MGAHHAPRSVVRWCQVLAGGVVLSAALLLCWFVLALFGAQASTNAGRATLTWALWGESSTAAYSAPVGQLVAGVGLLIFGSLMSKGGPRIRRSEHGIPTFAAPWRRAEIARRVREVQAATAYRQRRIGGRMIGFGIPAALSGALMIVLYPAVTEQIVDEGAQIAFGATAALAYGALGLVAAGAAVVAGVVFVARGPTRVASEAAVQAERSAASAPVAPAAVPPMPGTVPTLPTPPPPKP